MAFGTTFGDGKSNGELYNEWCMKHAAAKSGERNESNLEHVLELEGFPIGSEVVLLLVL